LTQSRRRSSQALGRRLTLAKRSTSSGGSSRKWREIASKENTYSDDALNGGWAYIPVDSPSERVMILAASGHSMAYVNGEPRAGDVYETGQVRLPIVLPRGT